MLITKASGITAEIVHTRQNLRNTTFQIAATEVVLSSVTDIDFEIPDSDFDLSDLDSYAGGWVALIINSIPVVLNSSNRSVSLFGTTVCRISKTADEQVGVAWVR